MEELTIEKISKIVLDGNPQLRAARQREENRKQWTREITVIHAQQHVMLTKLREEAEEKQRALEPVRRAFEEATRAHAQAERAWRQLKMELSTRRQRLMNNLRDSASPLIDATIATLRAKEERIRRRGFSLDQRMAQARPGDQVEISEEPHTEIEISTTLATVRTAIDACEALKVELLEEEDVSKRLSAIVNALPS